MIKVFAHINPDTDAICAPLAYAWILNNILETEAQAYSTGALNKETLFVLDYFQIEVPEIIETLGEQDRFVLMDTNNPEEIVKGYENAQLVEIVDHHKLVGGLSTEIPIKVTMREYGSTSSIVYSFLQEYQDIEIPEWVLGLILSGILSDTLNLTSPTTCDYDKAVVKEIAEMLKIDVNEFSSKMFEAKSSLEGVTIDDVLLGDCKNFNFGDVKTKITVLETTNPEAAKELKEDLQKRIIEIKSEEGCDDFFFFIVDIINSNSELLSTNGDENIIAEKAFNSKFDGDFMKLEGVVSRKKQIVPSIEKAIKGE